MKKIISLLMIALIITGCSCNKKEKVTPENNNNNTQINDSKTEDLKIIDFIVMYNNNVSSIYYEVVNSTEETKDYGKVSCALYDKDGNLLYTLEDEVGTLEPAASKNMKTNISEDLRNSKSIECSTE